ncbi:hypothetical protein J3A83DRAFT_4357170 [Scleroderma citrinum]
MLEERESAIPDFYYALFAFYEPALTILGFIGALSDPEATHNTQAPWPVDSPPPAVLPKASIVTVIQLAHVCALMGVVNFFVLTAIRRHLASQLVIQEKIVRALMIPLLIGDVMHLYVTLWALGDERWDIARWSPMLWTTILLGLTLMIPRIMWHLGIWRYMDSRDNVRVQERKQGYPQEKDSGQTL